MPGPDPFLGNRPRLAVTMPRLTHGPRGEYRELPTAVPHFKVGASQNTMKRPWRWVAILVAAPLGAVAGLYAGYAEGTVELKLQGLGHGHDDAWSVAGSAVLGSVFCLILFPMAAWFFT